MSRARNIANLLDSGGDVLASALDNVVGGGPSLGALSVVRTNATTISENITINATNGMSAGPITIADGYTVTIGSTGTWSIV